jgi:hypothetical protein
MTKRLLSAILLMILTSAIAHAAARVPQIPVSGTALQAFFTAHGQAINVNTDQLDLQTVSLPSNASIQITAPLVPNASSETFGFYNSSLATPPLYQVFPGAAINGWFAACSFRTAPMRLVVNLFYANSALQGTNTYLGADPANLGFYLQESGGSVFYSQDARNAAGARLLAFTSTGALAGGTWFAWETSAGPGGGDYADSIWLVGYAFAPVPVLHSDWGTLKRRFR